MILYLLKNEWQTDRGIQVDRWTNGKTDSDTSGIYNEKLRKEKNALRIEMKLRRKKLRSKKN